MSVRQIPLEDFFRNSPQAAFQLSPDGKHLSFMAPYQDRMNIFVRNLDEGEALMAIFGWTIRAYCL